MNKFVKGFVVFTDVNIASSNTMWHNYKEDAGASPPLTGLQNYAYLSKFEYCTFFSIDYEVFKDVAVDSPFTFERVNGTIISVTFTRSSEETSLTSIPYVSRTYDSIYLFITV